ncbi:hypothetical protein SO694_00016061 [Aureococcus anophagefferens]|uniref:Uncharacterized protein n=1 Tax=Aureococcus anophagefferens TaxID=44056 RepID=A0ABR1G2A6_AURAN
MLKQQVDYAAAPPDAAGAVEPLVEKAAAEKATFPYMSTMFSMEDKAAKAKADADRARARADAVEARRRAWEAWLVGAYENLAAVQSEAFADFFEDGDGAGEGLYGRGEAQGSGDAAIARAARTRRLVAEANAAAVTKEREALKATLREREAAIAALLGESELESAKESRAVAALRARRSALESFVEEQTLESDRRAEVREAAAAHRERLRDEVRRAGETADRARDDVAAGRDRHAAEKAAFEAKSDLLERAVDAAAASHRAAAERMGAAEERAPRARAQQPPGGRGGRGARGDARPRGLDEPRAGRAAPGRPRQGPGGEDARGADASRPSTAQGVQGARDAARPAPGRDDGPHAEPRGQRAGPPPRVDLYVRWAAAIDDELARSRKEDARLERLLANELENAVSGESALTRVHVGSLKRRDELKAAARRRARATRASRRGAREATAGDLEEASDAQSRARDVLGAAEADLKAAQGALKDPRIDGHEAKKAALRKDIADVHADWETESVSSGPSSTAPSASSSLSDDARARWSSGHLETGLHLSGRSPALPFFV